MQKIHLEVYHFADSLRPMAHFLLKIGDFPTRIPINAIVDTGSPITLIGPSDSKRIRLSPLQLKQLEGRNKPVNIGGGKIITKTIDNSKLVFANGFMIDMPVNFPISTGENTSQIEPSLLGIDFLEKTGAKFVFNPSKKEAYFEIE